LTVLKEYLAYKIFNEITEESFQVQLLKITFKDTSTGSSFQQWGFLIEDTAEMRNRLGATKSEQKRGLTKEAFNQSCFYKTAVFQYMIGNSDWDINAGRNVKMIVKNGKTLAIPYDFDFSGLVNADYAMPNSNYAMSSIKERVYMGFEADLAHLDPTLEFFKTKQTDIKNLVKNFKVLKMVDRMNVSHYLNSFYKKINDPIEYRTKKIMSAPKLASKLD